MITANSGDNGQGSTPEPVPSTISCLWKGVTRRIIKVTRHGEFCLGERCYAVKTDRDVRKGKAIESTKRNIVQAAARAFALRGFHGTTMEEIAHETGYSVGSLYNYFGSKEDLYRALIKNIAEKFESLHQQVLPPSLTFEQKLHWLFLRTFDVFETNREFFVMFLSQRGSFDWELGSDIGDMSRAGYLRWVDRIEELVCEGIEEGTVCGEEARDMAYFITGAVSVTVSRWVGGDSRESLAHQGKRLLSLILNGIGQTNRDE